MDEKQFLLWRYLRSALREFGLLGVTFQIVVSLIMVVMFAVFVYLLYHVLAAYDFQSLNFEQMVPVIVTGLIILSGLVAAGMIGLFFTFLIGQMRKSAGSRPRGVAPEEPPSRLPTRDQRLLAPPRRQIVEGSVVEPRDKRS